MTETIQEGPPSYQIHRIERVAGPVQAADQAPMYSVAGPVQAEGLQGYGRKQHEGGKEAEEEMNCVL